MSKTINLNHLNLYLVGGAVRDELLGRPVVERDWVVVGSTSETLLSLGFKSVGKDFPVFLHPETKEEYALARTERKTRPGYAGFEFHTESSVTLEEDLARRDLTINAIAKDEQGHLIDPFHGQADLKQKILRHVSPAFVEDPVRILRVARFAARFPDFSIANETNTLMQHMAGNGEVDALVAERVWQELAKALAEKAPQHFFDVLNECHALKIIFPEINTAAIRMLKAVSEKTDNTVIRFVALLHHEKNIKAFCKKLRIPNGYKEIAELTAKIYPNIETLNLNDAEALLSIIEKSDAFRRPERFEKALAALNFCWLANESSACPFIDILNKALQVAQKISINDIDKKLTGKAIADAIYNKRLERVKKTLLSS